MLILNWFISHFREKQKNDKKCLRIDPTQKNYFRKLGIKNSKKETKVEETKEEDKGKCCASCVNCFCCRKKSGNKRHPDVQGEKVESVRHNHDGDDDVKLIIRLVGAVPDSCREKTSFNNVRYFLLLLMELVIKKQCWLLIPEGNNKSLEKFLWKMNEAAAEHKELMFAEDPGEIEMNKFIEDKINHRTKECVIMCNGSDTRRWEIEKYMVIKKSVLILKGSGDMADIISTVQKKWLEMKTIDKNDREQLKQRLEADNANKIVDRIESQIKYTILDIGIKLTDHVIISHILQCIFDEPEKMVENFDRKNVDFLLLCVKLNQLDIADKIGGLWKIAFQVGEKRSESQKTTKSKSESNTVKKSILSNEACGTLEECKSQGQRIFSANAEDSGLRQKKFLPTHKAVIGSGFPVLHVRKKQLAISEMKSSLHEEPSFNESRSSSDNTLNSAPELPQKDKAPNVRVSKDSKEMNQFITVLNTTLQNSGVDHNSEKIPSVDK
ncbi:hypothetical protein Btru_076253 [Bulinus truncatus]|nr:hypothetical protein Btru_076253 [Bulinus truncatus]